MGEEKAIRIKMLKETPNPTILTKTAYEILVAAVGKMLEEGKKAGQQADSSLAKIYWNIGDRLQRRTCFA